MKSVRPWPLAVMACLCACLLTGCWQQNDTVTINYNGDVEFQSAVVITAKGFHSKDVEQFSDGFMEKMTHAGWKIERTWVSQKEPLTLSFSGSGNIHEVKSAVDFYEIKKLTEQAYEIRFIPAETQNGRSSRSIEFKFPKRFLAFGAAAKVLDENGSEVTEIKNVTASRVYKITF